MVCDCISSWSLLTFYFDDECSQVILLSRKYMYSVYESHIMHFADLLSNEIRLFK